MTHGVLRFSTAGSVDDGKSTLIGRLLYDAKSIFEDQLATLAATTARRGGVGGNQDAAVPLDLALLTDGLIAEREQGITIDVAYRYFATPRRKFIIADTPGHEQYTRNMVTGASTADLTIILVDARKGVSPQSRRHALVAALLGIGEVVVAINKMDTVGWSRERFESLRAEFLELTARLPQTRVRFVPLSALYGDMVVERGDNLSWYDGPTLLEILESAQAHEPRNGPLRFPVQLVHRPGVAGEYARGYMGRIESGTVRVGDTILVQPAGLRTRVRRIVTFDGDLDEAAAPRSVTLVLDDELDVSRGDVIVHEHQPAQVLRQFDAMLCWMDSEPLAPGRKYLLKHGTRTTPVAIPAVEHVLDIERFEERAATGLQLNEIGRVRLKVRDALAADPYVEERSGGAFILMDEFTNRTLAAGMIAGPASS